MNRSSADAVFDQINDCIDQIMIRFGEELVFSLVSMTGSIGFARMTGFLLRDRG